MLRAPELLEINSGHDPAPLRICAESGHETGSRSDRAGFSRFQGKLSRLDVGWETGIESNPKRTFNKMQSNGWHFRRS